jgi:hypothetical protein
VGFEANASAWTLLNTISVTGAGTTTAVRASLPVPIDVPANQMTGIYIFGSGVRYIGLAATPATIGQVWQTNGTLTLYGGIGGGALFSGGSNPGRTFAGHLYYVGADSLAWTDGTNFLGNADTLSVHPANTTTYYCTRFADSCSYTDTITVFVNPMVTDDIGVSALLTPQAMNQLGTPYPVKVVIENFGQTPATGFDVAYAVNGTEVNTNAISRTVAPGDTIHHTFTQAFTPTVGGDLRICAYTKGFATDINPGNDTSCVLFAAVNVTEVGAGLNRVYPNPASDFAQFELSEAADQQTRLILLDPLGKTVRSLTLEAGQQMVRLELQGLAAGLYSYRLERDAEVAGRKVGPFFMRCCLRPVGGVCACWVVAPARWSRELGSRAS